MRAAKVLAKDSIGHLSLNGQADVVVFDPKKLWTVTAHNLLSQGKHTPFSGFEFEGKVRATVVNGHLAYEGGV
jgi:dihydroorotase